MWTYCHESQNCKKFTQLIWQTLRKQHFNTNCPNCPLNPSPLLSRCLCFGSCLKWWQKGYYFFHLLIILREKGSLNEAWYNLHTSYRLYFRSYTAHNMVELASCRVRMQLYKWSPTQCWCCRTSSYSISSSRAYWPSERSRWLSDNGQERGQYPAILTE